jgi:hypothetical protein
MDFLIIAMDGTDDGAPDRRLAARPNHLAGIEKLKADGNFVAGGAILDDDGNMIGSVEILDYPDRASVEAAIAADPYSTGDVWRDVKIHPFRAVR